MCYKTQTPGTFIPQARVNEDDFYEIPSDFRFTHIRREENYRDPPSRVGYKRS